MEVPTGETTNRRGIGFPWEKVGLGNGEWINATVGGSGLGSEI